MSKVRTKDLALVAVAGGLLAFELVSLGEALPSATRAFTSRLPKSASVVPVEAASAAVIPTAEAVVPEAAEQVVVPEPVVVPEAVEKVVAHEAARAACDAASVEASDAAAAQASDAAIAEAGTGATCEASSAAVRAARAAGGCPKCKARSAGYVSSGAKCIVVTRDRGAKKAQATVRVFSWSGNGTLTARQLASSRRELRQMSELKKMIDVAPNQPTL